MIAAPLPGIGLRMNKRIAVSIAAGAVAIAVPAQAAAPGVSAQDENYLQMAAAGATFEIKGGQLALQRSQNPQIRSLATTLIKDHKKELSQVKAVAKSEGVPKVDAVPTGSQSWELRTLQGKTGTDFDKSYADLEVSDHHDDISDSKFEVAKGSSAVVRKQAKGYLPTLSRHLKLSREALKAVGGP
jgi:putative membrane protein